MKAGKQSAIKAIRDLTGKINRGFAPSWHQLGLADESWRSLPYHLKDVKPLNQQALTDMATAATKGRWLEARKWLTEPYTAVPVPSHIPEADMTAEGVKTMLKYKHCVEGSRTDALGEVRVFPTPEVHKNRNRVIKHCVGVNNNYGRDTLMGTQFLSRDSLLHSVLRGRYCVTLDFSAYFDVFEYAELIRGYFAFAHEGKVYFLTRMAMGQRQAVDVACAATDVLLDFPTDVYKDSHVDNVRFLSDDRDALIDAVHTFLQRCRTAGVTVNEVDLTGEVSRDCIATLVCTAGEYLGLDFDYTAKKVRVAAKSVAKLKATTALMRTGSFTYRNFLGHMALLMFVSPVLDLQVSRYYYAMRAYSRISADLQDKPWLLDTPLQISKSRMAILLAWSELALQNQWRGIEARRPPQHVLVTDASKWGWGGFVLNLATGAVRQVQGKWQDGYQGRRKSVYAETEGIKEALLATFAANEAADILILTDSDAAKGAFRKGRSMIFELNRAILAVQEHRPLLSIRVEHVEGKANVSDDLSRGKLPVADPQPHANAVRAQVLGLGISLEV